MGRTAYSGKRRLWTHKPPNKDEKKYGKHPTQKPLSLLNHIILANTNEQDIIMDPFSGSSTTGVAAVKLKRKYVGCELEPKFLELSVNRLEEVISMRQFLND